MAGLGNDLHEKELDKFVKELENQDYRVIKLNGKSPDAVAARVVGSEIEMVAVEALSSHYQKGKGWKKRFTYTQKQRIYSMFDNVLIHVFKMDPNVSKSSYCNFKGCRRTELIETQILDNQIFLCEFHRSLLLEDEPDNKTAFVYWCIDNLKKSIIRTLNK